jgi:hypothetical protein
LLSRRLRLGVVEEFLDVSLPLYLHGYLYMLLPSHRTPGGEATTPHPHTDFADDLVYQGLIPWVSSLQFFLLPEVAAAGRSLLRG